MYSSREKNKKEEKVFESIVYPTLPARASVSLLLEEKETKKKNRKRTVATKKSKRRISLAS